MENANIEPWAAFRALGKSRGVFYTPEGLSLLLAELVAEKNHQINHIYDPCVGAGELLIQAIRVLGPRRELHSVSGADIAPEAAGLARRRVIETLDDLYEDDVTRPEILIKCQDFFQIHGYPPLRECDAIVMNPPWGCEWPGFRDADPRNAGPMPARNYSEWAFVLGALHELYDYGVLAAILSPGALYRSGAEKKVRKSLIGKNLIDTVIELPPKLFSETAVHPVVVILMEGRKKTTVRFIQARELFDKSGSVNVISPYGHDDIVAAASHDVDIPHHARSVTIGKIRDQDYILSPNFYIHPEDTSERVDIGAVNRECRELREKNSQTLSAIDGLIDDVWGAGTGESPAADSADG